MIDKIGAPAAAGFAADRQPQPQDQKAPPPQQAAEAVPAPVVPQPTPGLRLVIERDDERCIYVYRLIDRETGKVVSSIPRSEIGKLAQSPDYTAGGLISTTA